jgi:UDP-N-acetylmuramoyl-tripeptide--D-alanyl-D-alanine ligase
MFKSTIEEIMSITEGTIEYIEDVHVAVEGVSTDSRFISPDNFFIALRGNKFDGHLFVGAAIEKGAVCVIVDDSFVNDKKIPAIRVKDTLKAYQDIARFWRNRFDIPVVAVTGSAGKTTTKELIAAMFKKSGKALKTEENFNNDVGVAKTLLELRDEYNFAVIEMGMRGKGEISRLSNIALPTVAVITNCGRAHIERLGSEEAIVRAKLEIVEGLPKEGTLVFHHDNELLRSIASEAWLGKKISFGLIDGDINGTLIDNEHVVEVDGKSYDLPLSGKHNALNFLATMAVADACGLDRSNLLNLRVNLPAGRGGRAEIPNDIMLFDETYNASPEAMLSALELLKSTEGKRHVAVLGEMRELGDFSIALHRSVGEKAAELNIDQVFVLVETESGRELFASINGNNTKKQLFENKEELSKFLKGNIKTGDRVLFKAAHSVGLESVLKDVTLELSKKGPQ